MQNDGYPDQGIDVPMSQSAPAPLIGSTKRESAGGDDRSISLLKCIKIRLMSPITLSW